MDFLPFFSAKNKYQKILWWINYLELVKQYIDKNKARPPKSSKNEEIKKLGRWIDRQQQIYNKKTQIMLKPDIYDKWTEFINDSNYAKYFSKNPLVIQVL